MLLGIVCDSIWKSVGSEDHQKSVIFSVSNNNKGIIETNTKGGFGVASDWPQLNKLAGKLRVNLTFENVEVEGLMDAGNAVLLYENGDVIRYGSNKALRKKLTLQQLETELLDIKQLKMQGTLIDLPNTDYLLSQDIFRNTN